MTIIAALGTAAAQQALQITINKVAEALIHGRSCIVQVNNRSSGILTRTNHGHSSGGFASGDGNIPDPEIPANSASVFGSESGGFMTGAVGFVVYAGDGIELVVNWSNPFFGDNHAEISVAGPNSHHFSTEAIAGNGDQKANFAYDLNPVTVGEFQDNWRWCSKCTSLYHAGDSPTGGVCPAGDQHDRGPSSNYLLRWEPPFTGQGDWRWCSKCTSLFHAAGSPTRGVCPAGGQHDQGPSSNYFLPMDDPAAPGQKDWRWCIKCASLFHTGVSPTGGVCSTGGQHDGTQSSNYTLIMQ